jgi:hypothetical protein
MYGEVGIEADRVDVEEGYGCDARVVGEFGKELGSDRRSRDYQRVWAQGIGLKQP